METSELINLFLGFDPGGKGKFGWSVCREVAGGLQCVKTGLADDAWHAIGKANESIAHGEHMHNSPVRAAGIDAPLLWNKRGDRKGYRKADCILRRALNKTHGPANRVLAINSLLGAVVVQGLLLVRHLSEMPRARDMMITESHPAAFRHLLSKARQPEMKKTADRLTADLATCKKRGAHKGDSKGCVICKQDSHRQDATLCAVAAWAAIRRPPKWQDLYHQDFGLFNPTQIPVCYWMPVPDELPGGS